MRILQNKEQKLQNKVKLIAHVKNLNLEEALAKTFVPCNRTRVKLFKVVECRSRYANLNFPSFPLEDGGQTSLHLADLQPPRSF